MTSNNSSHSGRGSSQNGDTGGKGGGKGKGPAKIAKNKVLASKGKGKKSKVQEKSDDHAGGRTITDNTSAPPPTVGFRLAASLMLVQNGPGAPELTTPRFLGSSSKDCLPPPRGSSALPTGTVTPYPAADPAARRAVRSTATQVLSKLGVYAPPMDDADLVYSNDSSSGSSGSSGSGSDGDGESGVESGSEEEEEDEAPDGEEKEEEEEGNDKDGEDDKDHEDGKGSKDDKDDNGDDDDMGSKGGGRGGSGGTSGGDAVDSDLESDIEEPDAGHDAGHHGGQGDNGSGSHTRNGTSVGNDMMGSAYHHHTGGGLLGTVGSIQSAYQAGVAWADDRRRRMVAQGDEAEPGVMTCPLRSPSPHIPCDAPVRTNPLIGNDGSDLLHPYVADGWLSVGGAAWQTTPAYTMPSYHSDWTTVYSNMHMPEPPIAHTPMPPSTRWMHQVGPPLLRVEPAVELAAVPPPTVAVVGEEHATDAAVAATVVQQQSWGMAPNPGGVMVSAPPPLNLGASALGAMATATAAAVDGAQEVTHMRDGTMGYTGGSSAPLKSLSTTPRPSLLPTPTPTTSAMTFEWAAPTGNDEYVGNHATVCGHMAASADYEAAAMMPVPLASTAPIRTGAPDKCPGHAVTPPTSPPACAAAWDLYVYLSARDSQGVALIDVLACVEFEVAAQKLLAAVVAV